MDDAIDLINQLLAPDCLSSIQEIVLRQSMDGKFYREIAMESGYDLDYIKEVGAQLWSCLSEALGEKVNKKNVYLVLSRLSSSRSQTATTEIDRELNEFPGGAVPLNSMLYISHPLLEERACAELQRPGCLIRLKAPRQMGKTSLLLRFLDHARTAGMKPVLLNLQQADDRVFSSLDGFLRWFCSYISRQLNLDARLDDYWDQGVGSKISCTLYFQIYLLSNLNTPLVLAIDEVNQIFEYPDLVRDFLPLLRSWHESAAEASPLQNLRLIIAHSTEVYAPLKLNQSPFNVGLPIQLVAFSPEQVTDLIQRYQLLDLDYSLADLERLAEFVNRHPFLLRLAFYELRQSRGSIAQLLADAPTQSGIYSDHLRRHLQTLQQEPKLYDGLQQVLQAIESVQLEAITAYRLESMGLISLNGNQATLSCELYRQYFQSQLS